MYATSSPIITITLTYIICVHVSLIILTLFDLLVIVTGDKDFIPALQKTRQKGMHTKYSDYTYSAYHDDICTRTLTYRCIYTILCYIHMTIPHNSDPSLSR